MGKRLEQASLKEKIFCSYNQIKNLISIFNNQRNKSLKNILFTHQVSKDISKDGTVSASVRCSNHRA